MFPEHQNCAKRRATHLYQTIPRLAKDASRSDPSLLLCRKTTCCFATQMRARLAAGRTTALPLLVRHSCHATSMGAAIAIDE